MFSRRSLVVSGSTAALAFPMISTLFAGAQGNTSPGSEVQGNGVNAGRTRVVPGDGLDNRPGEAVVAAEDIAFVWSTEPSPSIMLTAGVVLAHGGDDTSKYLVAFNASSGEELWRDVDVNGRAGAANGQVMYDVRPSDEAMPMHIKVVDALSGETRWVNPSLTSPTGVFPDDSSVVYTHLPDMSPELVSRNLETGDVNWEVDISDVAEWTGTLPTADENVVIVPSDAMRPWLGLTGYSVESGERLWHVDRENGIAIPSIAKGLVWAVYPDGVESFDVQSGEAIDRFDLPIFEPGVGQKLHSLCLKDGQLVIVGKERISAVETGSGELMWEIERAFEGQQSQLQVVNDMVVTIEPSDESAFDAVSMLRGYSLGSGEVGFEWIPPTDDSVLQAFLIADNHAYVSTTSGFYTFAPGNDPMTTATPV